MGIAKRLHIPDRSDERGIALAIALLAMLVIGALVTGTFFAARMEMTSGRNTVYTAQATEAAEAGLADAFAPWNGAWNSYAMEVNQPQTSVNPISGNTSVRYTQTVRRLKGGVYLISSTGEKLDRSGTVVASRMLARMGKLAKPWIDIQAAVTSKGDTDVQGNAEVDGHDVAPTGWTGCASAPDLAGVRSSGDVREIGSADIRGVPGPDGIDEYDSEVVDSLFQQPFDAMLPMKTFTLAPGTYNSMSPLAGGVCDKSNSMNWGEPRRLGSAVVACQSYFPIIYVNGNLHLTGGLGQGILLVSGDLRMQGGFEFVGVIIVLGEVITTANSSKVTGAILANNASLGDETSLGGTPLVSYSKCAIDKALASTAVGVPLSSRPWAQLNPR